MVQRLDRNGQNIGKAGNRNIQSGASALRPARGLVQEFDEDKLFEKLPGPVLTFSESGGADLHGQPVRIIRDEGECVCPALRKRRDGDATEQLKFMIRHARPPVDESQPTSEIPELLLDSEGTLSLADFGLVPIHCGLGIMNFLVTDDSAAPRDKLR